VQPLELLLLVLDLLLTPLSRLPPRIKGILAEQVTQWPQQSSGWQCEPHHFSVSAGHAACLSIDFG
jgi:hypothetical protein